MIVKERTNIAPIDKPIVIIGPYYNEIDHIWDVLENKIIVNEVYKLNEL